MKHRWFQFRLASLFALVFVASVPLAINAHRERRYRQRLAAAEVLARDNSVLVDVKRRGGGSDSVRTLGGGGRKDAALLRDEVAMEALLFSPSDEEFSALTFFPELEMLWCSGSVSDAQLAAVGRLRSLESLELPKTGIGDEGVRHLGKLQSMRTFDLSGNPRITDAAMQYLGSMHQLEELNLCGTSVDDEGARHISALQSLRVLRLSGARLRDEGVRRLCSLKQLRTLLLDGNDISDDALPDLARLPELTGLALGSRRVTDEGLSTLARSDSLRGVYVSGCAISDAGLVRLAQMQCLRKVTVRNTSVTANGIAELRRLKPKAGPLDAFTLAEIAEWGLDPKRYQDKEIEVDWDDPAEKHGNEGKPRQAGAAGSGFF